MIIIINNDNNNKKITIIIIIIIIDGRREIQWLVCLTTIPDVPVLTPGYILEICLVA